MKKINTLSLFFPFSLVIFAVAVTLFFSADKSETKTAVPTSLKTLKTDQDYYVFVSRAEAFSKQIQGGKEEEWDKPQNQAPDLFYEISWNGTTIFTSDVRNNCQVGHWRGIKLPISLNQIQNIINGSMQVDIEVEEMISAASIRATDEDIITIRLYDQDLLSGNDLVQEWTIPLRELKEGENTFSHTKNGVAKGCRSMTLRMVSRQGSIQDLLIPLLRDMNLKPGQEEQS